MHLNKHRLLKDLTVNVRMSCIDLLCFNLARISVYVAAMYLEKVGSAVVAKLIMQPCSLGQKNNPINPKRYQKNLKEIARQPLVLPCFTLHVVALLQLQKYKPSVFAVT